MGKPSISSANFQNGDQQEKRNRKVNEQGMETSDELHPVGSLFSVGRKQCGQSRHNQYRGEHHEPEAKSAQHSAVLPRCHGRTTAWVKKSIENVHARISATTLAGLTLVSFCSSP